MLLLTHSLGSWLLFAYMLQPVVSIKSAVLSWTVQVESNSLQRVIVSRLPLLQNLYIDKDGSPEVPQEVKWTKKSLEMISALGDLCSDERPELTLFAGTLTV